MSTLNNDNFDEYAVSNYINPNCVSVLEFLDDLKIIKYIKRLINKYADKQELKERLILNHIISLSNVFGVEATTITVEVNIDKGIGYHLVGLPDNAIKESSYRISAALNNNAYKLPGKKITINMAPADLRKEGSAYDLTLAIGILAASGQIRADEVAQYLIMGELSLDGGLQPIKGALSIAIKAKEEGFKGFFLPKQNVKETTIL